MAANYGPLGFFTNRGGGRFDDRAAASGLAVDSRYDACAPADVDHDGRLDLYVNGTVTGGTSYKDALYRNTGQTFVDVTPANLRALEADHGVQWADVDADGDLDLALTGSRPDGMHLVMRNLLRAADAGRSLQVRALDASGRATLAGAEVRVFAAGTSRLLGLRLVDAGSGYDAQSDLPVHVGLAPGTDSGRRAADRAARRTARRDLAARRRPGRLERQGADRARRAVGPRTMTRARHARRPAGRPPARRQQRPSPGPPGLAVRLVPAVLVLAAVLAFGTSVSAPFFLDDTEAIERNPYITALSPIGRVLTSPPQSAVSGRPLVSVSLALNYAAGRLDPAGYHLWNLAVHAAAGLLVWGIVRRTLRSPRLPPEVAASADAIAFVVALLWLVHPLHTEVIAYVVTRTESMMAVCYLLTIYAVIRASDAAGRRGWGALAIVACAVGATIKESIATAPVMALLYDATFGAGSLREALRRRGGLYAGCWPAGACSRPCTGTRRDPAAPASRPACRRSWRPPCRAPRPRTGASSGRA